uniref:Uncharacterized protein n=1 Tax=Populus trichocarpa TaxID=3694 RepID=B9HXY4_POPTR
MENYGHDKAGNEDESIVHYYASVGDAKLVSIFLVVMTFAPECLSLQGLNTTHVLYQRFSCSLMIKQCLPMKPTLLMLSSLPLMRLQAMVRAYLTLHQLS